MAADMSGLLAASLARLHQGLDPERIRQRVQDVGIKRFVNSCARLAAVSGGVAGAGGVLTLAVGLPADVMNTVAQQFRVTQGVISLRTGQAAVPLPYFLRIAGYAVGAEHNGGGVDVLGHAVATAIIRTIMARMTARMVPVPVVGSVSGASMNFMYIRMVGSALLALDDSAFDPDESIATDSHS